MTCIWEHLIHKLNLSQHLLMHPACCPGSPLCVCAIVDVVVVVVVISVVAITVAVVVFVVAIAAVAAVAVVFFVCFCVRVCPKWSPPP